MQDHEQITTEQTQVPPLNVPQESEPAPVAPVTPETEADAPENQEEAKADAPQPEPEGEQEEPEKPRKSAVQERIDRLTAQRRLAEERAAEASRRYRELAERVGAPADIDDMDWEEQERHRTRSVLDERDAEVAQRDAERAFAERQQLRNDTFMTKLEAAADRLPDVAEKFFAVPITEVAADALADSENAAEIAYWLGSNPHEAARIANLDPVSQIREIAYRDAQIKAAPKARKISQAPPPPAKITGQAAPVAKDPADMSDAEYSEWYRKRRAG